MALVNICSCTGGCRKTGYWCGHGDGIDSRQRYMNRCFRPEEARFSHAWPLLLLRIRKYAGLESGRTNLVQNVARKREKMPQPGLRNRTKWFLFFAMTWASQVAVAANHALLIGVSELKHYPAQFHLKGPLNDIPVVKELLVQRMGFDAANIKVLEHQAANASNIIQALADLSKTTQAGETVFIYYSGHGIQLPDDTNNASGFASDGMNEAIAPYDSNPNTNENFIRDYTIGRHLDKLAGRQVIYMADACHSASGTRAVLGTKSAAYRALPTIFPNGTEVRGLGRENDRKSAKVNDAYFEKLPPNLLFIAAAQVGQKAEDLVNARAALTLDGKAHGNLTDAFVRAFSGEIKGEITNRDLKHFLTSKVTSRSFHEPSFETNLANLDQPFLARSASAPMPAPTVPAASPTRASPRDALLIGFVDIAEEAMLKEQIAKVVPPELITYAQANEVPDVAFRNKDGRIELVYQNGQVIATNATATFGKRAVGVKNKKKFGQPDGDMIEGLNIVAKSKQLMQLGKGKGFFKLAVEVPDGRYRFHKDEELFFSLKSEKDASLLLLNISQSGDVNVLLPNGVSHISTVKKNQLTRVPSDETFFVKEPFGLDGLKAYAFVSRPPFLNNLVPKTGDYTEFGINSAQANELLENLKSWIESHKDWAEASINFETDGNQ